LHNIPKTVRSGTQVSDPDALLSEVLRLAQGILRSGPDPAVRCRLLCEVLRLADDDPALEESRSDLQNSRHIQLLAQAQQPDGGWGRFHSRDSQIRTRVPTTEWAVERALALGMRPAAPLLKRAARHIYEMLTWKEEFPDPPEKNDRWPLGMRLFMAATLASLQPANPILVKERSLWRNIASLTFYSGRYSARAEIRAHQELTGASVAVSYLVLNGRYQVILLGCVRGFLSPDLEQDYVSWLWDLPQGIGYFGVPLPPPAPSRAGDFERWLASHMLLSRYFPDWAEHAEPLIGWLWDQRIANGGWDFGPRAAGMPYLPLSDSWRRPDNRATDWTVRILILTRRYLDRYFRQAQDESQRWNAFKPDATGNSSGLFLMD
jgi:hypothetical protein